ncbi:MAG: single-stranded DNA-binding protein [Saprospiraceae bacterium]
MINKVILIGNLGKDPDVRKLENNSFVARFPLATHENYRDKSGNWQKVTDWHNIVVWGNQAERAEKMLHKGSTIYLEGKLKTRKWNDNSGAERYTTEVIALSYKILDKKVMKEIQPWADLLMKTI